MRNSQLELLNTLVGRWEMTLSDAWFLEPAEIQGSGTATATWLGEAFVVLRWEFDNDSSNTLVLGRSDARDAYVALYHDDRGVLRVFDMTFDGRSWTMERADPDFHQRFLATVEPDRIAGRWEASEDEGRTWRKDFDLTFVRAADQDTGTQW